MDVGLLIMAEIIPSLAFLFLVNKKKADGERSSLLTTVVNQSGAMNGLLGGHDSSSNIEGHSTRGAGMLARAASKP